MANMEPRYERKLPKLCFFFARGECNRGADCPFHHEMPRDGNDPLSKQNTKDRFYGANDPVAIKLCARMKQLEEEGKEEEKRQDGYDHARAIVYYISSCREMGRFLPYRKGMPGNQFYSFGEIVSVRVIADKASAFRGVHPTRSCRAGYCHYESQDATGAYNVRFLGPCAQAWQCTRTTLRNSNRQAHFSATGRTLSSTLTMDMHHAMLMDHQLNKKNRCRESLSTCMSIAYLLHFRVVLVYFN
jgi:hypothetical protein